MATFVSHCGIKMLVAFIFFTAYCYYPVLAYYYSGKRTPYREIYPPLDMQISNCTVEERVPLYFGLMMSFGGDVKSSGAIPGVQVALDAINNQPDLLPGYTLHYTLTDSQVWVYIHNFDLYV